MEETMEFGAALRCRASVIAPSGSTQDRFHAAYRNGACVSG